MNNTGGGLLSKAGSFFMWKVWYRVSKLGLQRSVEKLSFKHVKCISKNIANIFVWGLKICGFGIL